MELLSELLKHHIADIVDSIRSLHDMVCEEDLVSLYFLSILLFGHSSIIILCSCSILSVVAICDINR